MKRVLLAGFCAFLVPTAALAQSVYTRAWCNNPAHGRNARGGYGWISEVIRSHSSDECWRFANGHRQPRHHTGCNYVNPRTGELN